MRIAQISISRQRTTPIRVESKKAAKISIERIKERMHGAYIMLRNRRGRGSGERDNEDAAMVTPTAGHHHNARVLTLGQNKKRFRALGLLTRWTSAMRKIMLEKALFILHRSTFMSHDDNQRRSTVNERQRRAW